MKIYRGLNNNIYAKIVYNRGFRKEVSQSGQRPNIRFFFDKSNALSYLNKFFNVVSTAKYREMQNKWVGVSKFLKLRNRGALVNSWR